MVLGEPIKIVRCFYRLLRLGKLAGALFLPALFLASPYARAQTAAEYNSRYYPQYAPYTDHRLQPVMPVQMFENVNGYASPKTYNLGNQRPQFVYTANGLPYQPVAPVNRDAASNFSTFYLSLERAWNADYTGSSVSSNYTYYPSNNDKYASMGAPSIMGFGLGAVDKSGLRFELGLRMLSGLNYGAEGITADSQVCDVTIDDIAAHGRFFDCSKSDFWISGGKISSRAVTAGVYLQLDEYLKNFVDDNLHPYVGVAIGVSQNTIEDYEIGEPIGYGEPPIMIDPDDPRSYGFYDYEGTIKHFGLTTRGSFWSVEAGVGFNLSPKTTLDVYYRRTSWGVVRSSDDIVTAYNRMDIMFPEMDAGGMFVLDEYDEPRCLVESFYYMDDTGWCEADGGFVVGHESGAAETAELSTTEIGFKLRFAF